LARCSIYAYTRSRPSQSNAGSDARRIVEIGQRYAFARMISRRQVAPVFALGIVEIKMGKGGGARIARGNARLFAEALAVQLDLTGVSAAEIMDAQRAIECLAAELAAENATEDDVSRLRQLVDDADTAIGDAARFTELGAAFHLAVAEASHNRVLVVQLISLQHVSWPRRNPTLTPKVMRRVNEVHRELLGLIEILAHGDVPLAARDVVVTLHHLEDARLGGDPWVDPRAGGERQLVEGRQVARVDHRCRLARRAIVRRASRQRHPLRRSIVIASELATRR